MRRLARLRPWVTRGPAFAVGVLVLYHEVWVAENSELLLIGLGLWLCGIPPVLFLEDIRRLGNQVRRELDETDATLRRQSSRKEDEQ